MKKIKTVAMLGSFPPLRALSGYCLELALAVAKLNNVLFISFKKIYPAFLYPGRKLFDDHSFPEISCKNLDVKRRLTWYNPFSWLFEGLFTKGDLLHAQWWSIPLFPVYFCICAGYRLRGKPVVITVHNLLPHNSPCLFVYVSGLLFKLGNHFIVHTELNLHQMRKIYRIPENRVSLIPHGPLDFHINQAVDKDSARSEMGFGQNEKIILLFGAIRPYKGIDTALKAFSKIKDKISGARLIIAGKLWESWEPYQKLIKDLKIESYVSAHLDYIPAGEVHNFFCVSDLVILPYHKFDSQSGVGSTALSFQKPMIVTDVGGLPCLVKDKRFIIPENNDSALAEAVINCLNDPVLLEKMSKDSKDIAKDIAWPDIAEKTLAVYNRVGLRAVDG